MIPSGLHVVKHVRSLMKHLNRSLRERERETSLRLIYMK